jgi:hypothetical protein
MVSHIFPSTVQLQTSYITLETFVIGSLLASLCNSVLYFVAHRKQGIYDKRNVTTDLHALEIFLSNICYLTD